MCLDLSRFDLSFLEFLNVPKLNIWFPCRLFCAICQSLFGIMLKGD